MEYGRGCGRHESITHIFEMSYALCYKIAATAASSSNLKALHSD